MTAPAGPRVVVLHNVQRLCGGDHEGKECGQPVYRVTDGCYYHRDPLIDHPVTDAPVASLSRGYSTGDSLSPVFITELPPGFTGHPVAAAGLLYSAANAPHGQLPEFWTRLGDTYRTRRLRPLSTGDVLVIDGRAFTIRGGVWVEVPGRLRLVTSAEPGSWSMAFCTYCHHVPADRGELEEFNRAGNLACRDVTACSGRCNTPPASAADSSPAQGRDAESLGPSYRINNHKNERDNWCRSSLLPISANLYRTGDGRCLHNCPDSAYEEVPADAR